MLTALAGLLLLIILIGLFMNYQSKQKIQQISTANGNTGSSPVPTSNSQQAQDTQPARQDSEYAPGVMDRNIQHMNQYNQELMLYSNRQNDLIGEWHILQQTAYGQDRLDIRYTLDKMVAVYKRLDRLDTPECKRKEKYKWMQEIQEGIEQINVSDSGTIVSFSPEATPDVEAYDCFASMPPPK